MTRRYRVVEGDGTADCAVWRGEGGGGEGGQAWQGSCVGVSWSGAIS
jgi:hypothetical protein